MFALANKILNFMGVYQFIHMIGIKTLAIILLVAASTAYDFGDLEICGRNEQCSNIGMTDLKLTFMPIGDDLFVVGSFFGANRKTATITGKVLNNAEIKIYDAIHRKSLLMGGTYQLDFSTMTFTFDGLTITAMLDHSTDGRIESAYGKGTISEVDLPMDAATDSATDLPTNVPAVVVTTNFNFKPCIDEL